MNKDSRLVVKDNALINASFNLSLVEQRLMLLAIVEARELPTLTSSTAIEIKATTYQEQYNTDKSEAYKQLVEASDTLFDRKFSYIKDGETISKRRWLAGIDYKQKQGQIFLYLSDDVIGMISRLEANFTKYLLIQVSDFKSKYSIRLYELIAQYKGVGNSKKYSINELRSLLKVGVEEYALLSDFKKRVIDNAITEINKKSDLIFSYDQFKQGRTVTHIQFKVKPKQVDKKTDASRSIKLTPKQVDMFADKLSRDVSFQQHYQANIGEEREAYAQRIAEKLSDSFYINEWLSFLIEVGFKPRDAK